EGGALDDHLRADVVDRGAEALRRNAAPRLTDHAGAARRSVRGRRAGFADEVVGIAGLGPVAHVAVAAVRIGRALGSDALLVGVAAVAPAARRARAQRSAGLAREVAAGLGAVARVAVVAVAGVGALHRRACQVYADVERRRAALRAVRERRARLALVVGAAGLRPRADVAVVAIGVVETPDAEGARAGDADVVGARAALRPVRHRGARLALEVGAAGLGAVARVAVGAVRVRSEERRV